MSVDDISLIQKNRIQRSSKLDCAFVFKSKVCMCHKKKIIDYICIFVDSFFVKLIPLFKVHIHVNKNGRPSFASSYGNAISGQTALK